MQANNGVYLKLHAEPNEQRNSPITDTSPSRTTLQLLAYQATRQPALLNTGTRCAQCACDLGVLLNSCTEFRLQRRGMDAICMQALAESLSIPHEGLDIWIADNNMRAGYSFLLVQLPYMQFMDAHDPRNGLKVVLDVGDVDAKWRRL